MTKTKPLFNKIIAFTDIHFGRKGNEYQANKDNEDFITWAMEEADKFGADSMVFLGDWHESRHNLHIQTMNFSLDNMERLNNHFKKVWFIPGNHDLFYKDKRDLNSIAFSRNLNNFEIIQENTIIGDVAFIPWIVGDEWKEVVKIKSKYMFGHFEIPNFYMNAMIKMPSRGGLDARDFQSQEFVFSGHFHKRQRSNNIWYIGNTFPTSYSDVDDDERGIMLLEWGKEPQFKSWDNAPTYRVMKVSELLSDPDAYMVANSYNRVTIDVDMTYEEAQFLNESMTNNYNVRKIDLIPMNRMADYTEDSEDIEFHTVDQMVIDGLNTIESGGISNIKLIDIYNNLT